MTPELARNLRDAVRTLVVAHGVLNEQRRPCGTPLSLPHAYALLELLDRPNGMTVGEIAARLSIDRSNVSRLCSKLERVGDVVGTPDPEDGRAKRLVLTPKGKRLARDVDARSAEHFVALARSLGRRAKSVIQNLQAVERAMRAHAKGTD